MAIALCGALLAPGSGFAQSDQDSRCFPWQELRDGACVAKSSQAPGQSRQLDDAARPLAGNSRPGCATRSSRCYSPCGAATAGAFCRDARGTAASSAGRSRARCGGCAGYDPLRWRNGERQHLQLPRRLRCFRRRQAAAAPACAAMPTRAAAECRPWPASACATAASTMSGESYALEFLGGKCVPKRCPDNSYLREGKCVASNDTRFTFTCRTGYIPDDHIASTATNGLRCVPDPTFCPADAKRKDGTCAKTAAIGIACFEGRCLCGPNADWVRLSLPMHGALSQCQRRLRVGIDGFRRYRRQEQAGAAIDGAVGEVGDVPARHGAHAFRQLRRRRRAAESAQRRRTRHLL